MVLVSPGVEVTVIDQSQYLAAPSNSIPLVVFATAQNKANPNGTGVAIGTTAANAGKLFQVTSQRDLVTLYGNPFFYTDTAGTPIQGYELNEYGLLTAYSALGATNTVYCLRADIDLASLVGKTARPSGNPEAGAWWLDTTTSTWGINVFDATTGQFSAVTPIVITDTALLSGSYPVQSLGTPGSYAVNAVPTYSYPSSSTAAQFFYKNAANVWVLIGSTAWLNSVPTVSGTGAPTQLTEGDTLTITLVNGASATITIPATPDNTVSWLSSQIIGLGWKDLYSSATNGALKLYSLDTDSSVGNNGITISGSSTLLTALGITAGTYYQPAVSWGNSSQQPLWQTGQTTPRPSGSVWFKVGSAGSGLDVSINEWNALTATWMAKTVTYSTADWRAISGLDSTGGKNIPAGTVYTQYNYDATSTTYISSVPLYYWERIASGPTVITGNVTNPVFSGSPYTFRVQVSIPGDSSLSSAYTISAATITNATQFVAAIQRAAIPYVSALVTESGAIQLTHTEGGVIVLNDYNLTTGISNGLIAAAGFVAGTTTGVKEGPYANCTFTPNQTSSSGNGSGFIPVVTNIYGRYEFDANTFNNGGGGYVAGDTITFAGTSFGGASPANDLILQVSSIGGGGAVTAVTQVRPSGSVTGVPPQIYTTQLSNWVEFSMTASNGAPVANPANLTNWFYSSVDQVDIMINTSNGWKGYRNATYDLNGFPLPSGTNYTDPNGPIISATAPIVQSDGSDLVYGDLWIDTTDLENYPLINRWQEVGGVDQWVRLDNTNQVSSTGVLFADARWSYSGAINPVDDPIPSIASMLTSNYLDLDAPESYLYPVGMLLFNTRRSGYNVKQFRTNYFTSANYPNAGAFNPGAPTNTANLPEFTYTWVTVSGNQSNGAPYMGRQAQRAMVVKALKAAIDTNTAIRDEDNYFNLQATPAYPELQQNMIALNNDRGNTGFIIGDTPMRLPDDATAITAWANSQPSEGGPARDSYMGLFYPSGLTTDLSGNQVVVPPSYMMIRTILRNDNIAYPWFAPAGTRRGIIDNALSIGYIDPMTGEYQPIKTRIGIRDVLYTNQINPLVFFTGNGLLNYGNKTSYNSSSALDRINVARLVAYIRRQLTLAARPFIFEPNDSLTRQQITAVIQTLFVDLVAKRGVYDYLVVCDDSNNTPARIDRNELWVDVAIEPVKAVEFIYIPVRILNTGEIKALNA